MDCKLINVTLMLCLALIGYSKAYVVYHSTENGNALEEAAQTKQHTNSVTESNIMNLVHPSEIRIPTIEQLKPFIKRQEESTPESKLISPQKEPKSEVEEEQKHIVGYSELYQLLALWQLENEKNFYEMTETPLENSTDNKYVNNNNNNHNE